MVKKISRDELKNMIRRNEDFRLVDVLSRESFEKEHIKGAISIPVDEIDQKARGLLNKDDKIVTYCASFDCQASTHAAEALQKLGYAHVFDYKGGLKDYKEGNLPMEGNVCAQGAGAVAGCCVC